MVLLNILDLWVFCKETKYHLSIIDSAENVVFLFEHFKETVNQSKNKTINTSNIYTLTKNKVKNLALKLNYIIFVIY